MIELTIGYPMYVNPIIPPASLAKFDDSSALYPGIDRFFRNDLGDRCPSHWQAPICQDVEGNDDVRSLFGTAQRRLCNFTIFVCRDMIYDILN